MSEIFIAGAKRTPIGSFQGQFDGVPTTQLGSTAISAAIGHAGVPVESIEEVIMGCVLPANLGQAPARQAALGAGLPRSAGATTINKVCGSGMKAIMQAHDAIKAGSIHVAIAGGMESMTNAPYLLPRARGGYRMGDAQVIDHMMWDGLTNPYDRQAMGVFGEMCVNQFAMTREEQDEFAAESARRAVAAIENGSFRDEIAAVKVTTRKGDVEIVNDEEPPRIDIAKIPTLKPAFKRDGGTITAASSSKISDGAAATVVLSAAAAERYRATPLARIVAHATHSHDPEWFTTAPVFAIQRVLERAGWSKRDVDLFEINEAFACVAMAPIKELGLDHAKVNVNGGACALGHPIGASGARIVVTLIHALRARGGKRGVASLCIGGGEATALAIELV